MEEATSNAEGDAINEKEVVKMDNYNNRKQQFKDSGKPEKKPERYSTDSFTKILIGKIVKVDLINNKEIQGRIIEIGMFDLLIQTSQARLIIFKSSIITVEVVG